MILVKEVWRYASGEHSMNISKFCSRAVAIVLASIAVAFGGIAAAEEVA